MKNTRQRIVITGGNGFIGLHLIEKLLARGYKNILTIDRSMEKHKVRQIRADISNIKRVKGIIKKDDVIVHLACTTVPATSESRIIDDINENIVGSIRLLDVCASKKIRKFIFLSSGGTVYGDHGEKKVRENDETNPINAHGLMKLTIEKYIMLLSYKSSLPYIIIRASNPFGRSVIRSSQGVIDKFLHDAMKDGVIEVWGNGSVIRDFIYIDDLIELIVKTIESGKKNQIINAGTGRGASVNNAIKIISNVIGKRIKVKYKKRREFDLPYNVLDVSKAKRLFHWRPRYSVAKGVNIIYNKKYIKTL
jgi:UDP-glucose 4-epimerase